MAYVHGFKVVDTNFKGKTIQNCLVVANSDQDVIDIYNNFPPGTIITVHIESQIPEYRNYTKDYYIVVEDGKNRSVKEITPGMVTLKTSQTILQSLITTFSRRSHSRSRRRSHSRSRSRSRSSHSRDNYMNQFFGNGGKRKTMKKSK